MLKFINECRGRVTLALTVCAFAAMTAVASATPTYDVAPVTTSITTELAANLPVILGIIGALVALAIAVKAVRKFAHV